MTEKYTFDLDFDEERVRLQQERNKQNAEKKRLAEDQMREDAKLRYTPEQIEELKNQARDEGKRLGVEETKQSQEKAVLDMLGHMMNHVQKLEEEEKTREKIAQRTGVETAFHLLQKISPALTKDKALDDIDAIIQQAFEENPDQQRLVIRVHDSVLDKIVKNIDTVAAQSGFSGKPIVLADQNLQPQDCRVEWADGGLERITSNLWDGLEKAINHILIGLPKASKKEIKSEEESETNAEDVSIKTQTEDKVTEKVEAVSTTIDTEKKEEVSDE